MASSNPPPTWATQDPDDQPSRVSKSVSKHSSADVDEELDVVAASSVVGSSPVKSAHPADKMEVDEEEDAETARNRAAEALSDLANAAVFAAPLPVKPPSNTANPNEPPAHMPAPQITTPADALAKKQRRPAALLTPTRRAGPSRAQQHLSPNPSAGASSSSRRSPLGSNLDQPNGSAETAPLDSSAQEQHLSHLATSANGTHSPLYAASPNRTERPVAEKGKSAYNSPFTNQPFVCIMSPVSIPESGIDAFVLAFALAGCWSTRYIYECAHYQHRHAERRTDLSCATKGGWRNVYPCGSTGMATILHAR